MISPVRVDADDDAGLTDPGTGRTRPNVVAATATEFRAALTMLTRLPVPGNGGMRTGAAAFGIVGGLIGLVGLVPLLGLGAAVAPISAILAVAAIAVVSGAIHLDGLADTADALMATGPDGAERARADPSVGVGGVASIVLVLAAQATSLALVAANAGPLTAGIVCVVAGVVSRVVPVVVVRLTRARAQASGLGSWFAARTTTAGAVVAVGSAVAICLAAALLPGSPAAGLAGGVGGLGGLVLALGLVRVRGQLDGDVLGAGVELSFALTVLAAAVIVGSAR